MIHKFSTGPPNDQSCKVTIQLAWWFLTRRFLKYQPMRTHYGPWQPCWISNQHQKQTSGRGPSNEHFWQVWFKSVQWFQRRRFKCENLTDGQRRWTPSHDKSSHSLWQGFQSGPVPGTFTRLRSCIVPAEITEPPKISGGENHKYDGR